MRFFLGAGPNWSAFSAAFAPIFASPYDQRRQPCPSLLAATPLSLAA